MIYQVQAELDEPRTLGLFTYLSYTEAFLGAQWLKDMGWRVTSAPEQPEWPQLFPLEAAA